MPVILQQSQSKLPAWSSVSFLFFSINFFFNLFYVIFVGFTYTPVHWHSKIKLCSWPIHTAGYSPASAACALAHHSLATCPVLSEHQVLCTVGDSSGKLLPVLTSYSQGSPTPHPICSSWNECRSFPVGTRVTSPTRRSFLTCNYLAISFASIHLSSWHRGTVLLCGSQVPTVSKFAGRLSGNPTSVSHWLLPNVTGLQIQETGFMSSYLSLPEKW